MKFTKEQLTAAGIGAAAVVIIGVALGLHVVQKTDSAPPQTPAPIQETADTLIPTETEQAKEMVCTITVRCDTALRHADLLPAEKQGMLPENGILFSAETVEFSKGETVLDVTKRALQAEKVQFETARMSGYDSVYFKGIANLYEQDCGAVSGWLFRVNGEFGDTDCSHHALSPGDEIEWVYTCDMGRDVGAMQ